MIGNNLLITGSSRFLNPINGSCTNGTTVTTQTQSTKFMREDGTWSAPSYTAATTDKYHTTGTWSGLTYTATANGGAGALAFTIPTGTTASTVCVGNDSRLSDARTPTSHTHGNIQNGGTLQTNDITIASGDKLVVTDSSDSNKIARTSASFSATVSSQTQSTKFLREDGTFAAPSYTTNTDTKVTQTPFGTVSSNATYELLFSGSADNTEHTETTKKSSYATFDPYEKAFTFGTRSTGGVGSSSFAEGFSVIASGNYSHAEGYNTTASEANSHAEGYHTTASGNSSHAEGYYTTVSGDKSHAEGDHTSAIGSNSHAEGYHTTATHRSQHVFGEYSVADYSTADATDRGNYIEIVGNGTSGTARSNARTLDWNGNEWLAGSLSIASITGNTASVISNSFCQIMNKTQTSMVGMGMDTNYYPSFGIFADNKNLTATNSDITLAGTSNTWDGTNTSLKTAVTDKVSKSTGTTVDNPISGAIAITDSYFSKVASVDLSKSNNNLSSDYYGLVDFRDKNKKRFGYTQYAVRTSGQTDASLRAVNYPAGGTTEYTNSLTLMTSKAGAYTYSVANATNFRSAIGAAASSSIKTKENISDLTEEEALKLLKIRPVSFDYKQGFDIDNKYERNYGVIAEETIDIIPSVVNVPTTEGWEFDAEAGTNQELITVDYAKFVPYLIKLVQMQQQEIDELKNR